jgi:catechol 2,3-dioxygenase-like lactoylglutathione lyase family enzyme
MSETATAVQSALTWFEIPTADFDRARRFYETILGTTLNEHPFGPARIAIYPYAEPGLNQIAAEAGRDGLGRFFGGVFALHGEELANRSPNAAGFKGGMRQGSSRLVSTFRTSARTALGQLFERVVVVLRLVHHVDLDRFAFGIVSEHSHTRPPKSPES